MRSTPLLFEAPVTTDVTLVTTAETVIAALVGVSNYQAGQPVQLRGWCQWTPGTGTTGFTLRIRQGTDATGALVGEANAEGIEGAVGATEDHEIELTHLPAGELANAGYVLTLQQAAASANGTVVQAKLEAVVG